MYGFYIVLVVLLLIILVQKAGKDGTRHFRLPDARNIHPVTLSAMHGDIFIYIYTVLYSLQGKGYIELPDDLFEENAKAVIKVSEGDGYVDFEHNAEKTVFEVLKADGLLANLLEKKQQKQIKRDFQDDKRKVRDMHLMRKPSMVRRAQFLYFLFIGVVLISGVFLIYNQILSNIDYAVPVFLTAIGVLLFVFYRRPFDKKSNLGKRLIMDAIKAIQNEEFPKSKHMAYHTALYGYNTIQHKGSATHTNLTKTGKSGPQASGKKPKDKMGPAPENDYDDGGSDD